MSTAPCPRSTMPGRNRLHRPHTAAKSTSTIDSSAAGSLRDRTERGQTSVVDQDLRCEATRLDLGQQAGTRASRSARSAGTTCAMVGSPSASDFSCRPTARPGHELVPTSREFTHDLGFDAARGAGDDRDAAGAGGWKSQDRNMRVGLLASRGELGHNDAKNVRTISGSPKEHEIVLI